jgi:hypothetical protein
MTIELGQPWQDSWYRTPGQDNQKRPVWMGQPDKAAWKISLDRIEKIGLPGHDRKDRTTASELWTWLLGHSRGMERG